MYYEFGIFSTILMGNHVIPSRNEPIHFETSTSFTIPPTFNKLRGLNLCIVCWCFELPKIRMSNITKNCTWIYNHCIIDGCWVHLVYDSVDDMTRRLKWNGVDYGKMENEEEEEEDPLDYYKSWNHIIGGDLSPFQLTTGEYFLNSMDFLRTLYSSDSNAHFREKEVSFRAFSQTRPDMFDGLPPQNYSPSFLPHATRPQPARCRRPYARQRHYFFTAIPLRIIVPEHQDYTETGGTIRATEVECSVLPNTSIKNWRKVRFLGSGSHGIVYEGLTKHGFFFAVKEVSLIDEGRGKQSIVQLEQEISLLSQLKHKNIVRYLGTDTCDDKLYIFLELVTKGSLANLYQKYHLEDSQVSAYTRQILGGLNYLHKRGVVHRDIKCANILVDANGSVKLADFGLAKVTKLNDIKSCKGSPYWMAPEVVNLKNNGYGLAADIWSLGCTVLEMLTSKIPYSPLEKMPALFRIGRGERPPIPDTLSIEAQDFILRCLQVNPNDRQTAAQLLIHPFVDAQSL